MPSSVIFLMTHGILMRSKWPAVPDSSNWYCTLVVGICIFVGVGTIVSVFNCIFKLISVALYDFWLSYDEVLAELTSLHVYYQVYFASFISPIIIEVWYFMVGYLRYHNCSSVNICFCATSCWYVDVSVGILVWFIDVGCVWSLFLINNFRKMFFWDSDDCVGYGKLCVQWSKFNCQYFLVFCQIYHQVVIQNGCGYQVLLLFGHFSWYYGFRCGTKTSLVIFYSTNVIMMRLFYMSLCVVINHSVKLYKVLFIASVFF